MKKLKALSMALCIALPSMALADNQGTEVYFSVDHTNWDNEREVDDEFGLGLGVAVPLNERWYLEGWYAGSDTESGPQDTDLDVETWTVNSLYNFKPASSFQPFITMGASYQRFDSDIASTDKDTTADFGVGFKQRFGNNIVFRTDVIGMLSVEEEHNTDTLVRLSIGYAFGGQSKPVVKSVAPPVQQPVRRPVADSDGDGVNDNLDKCPGTASNLKVDDMGCGLTLSEVVSINMEVTFTNNSDAIDPRYYAEIKKVADFMSMYEAVQVEVQGHTDGRGSAAYNKVLSDKRAKAVAQVLVERYGVERNRVSANGYGEEKPIADNTTASGRAKNRRVVADVSARVTKPLTK